MPFSCIKIAYLENVWKKEAICITVASWEWKRNFPHIKPVHCELIYGQKVIAAYKLMHSWMQE